MKYTVIGYYGDNDQRFVHHAEAETPEMSVTAAIRDNENGENMVIVDVIEGHHNGLLEGGSIWDAEDCNWDIDHSTIDNTTGESTP